MLHTAGDAAAMLLISTAVSSAVPKTPACTRPRFEARHGSTRGRMRAAAGACRCCNIGSLLRSSGRFAVEDQHFAHGDQQRCNESEPSVAFHECLRECCLL